MFPETGAVLTGKQIREARLLLGWGKLRLSRAAQVTVNFVSAIESSEGEAWLSAGQEEAIRRAFGAAGVEFTADGARSKVKR